LPSYYPSEKYYSIVDIAHWLGLSEYAALRRLKEDFPHTYVGKKTFFMHDTIAEWAKSDWVQKQLTAPVDQEKADQEKETNMPNISRSEGQVPILWTPEEDALLITMRKEGVSTSKIAEALTKMGGNKRTNKALNSRLHRLRKDEVEIFSRPYRRRMSRETKHQLYKLITEILGDKKLKSNTLIKQLQKNQSINTDHRTEQTLRVLLLHWAKEGMLERPCHGYYRVPTKRPHGPSVVKKTNNELMNVQETANWLRTSKNAIYLMIKKGQLPPPIRIGKKRIRFDQESLSKWLNGHIANSKKEPSRPTPIESGPISNGPIINVPLHIVEAALAENWNLKKILWIKDVYEKMGDQLDITTKEKCISFVEKLRTLAPFNS
jgi:predicted DNA-binding transcriptional regulator AlpA